MAAAVKPTALWVVVIAAWWVVEAKAVGLAVEEVAVSLAGKAVALAALWVAELTGWRCLV